MPRDHGTKYIKATGSDGLIYYRFVRKDTDTQRQALRVAVIQATGGCRGVTGVKKPPMGGIAI